MRKCLGVLAGFVVLCVMSWAQAPAPAPTPAPAPAPAPAPQDKTPQAPAPQPSPQQTSPGTSSSMPPHKTSTLPNYPRVELFAGYSFAQAGFFNAGHWAQLNGWNASFGLNAASWLGLVVDGSEYFGNSQIPTATPAPFPVCGGSPVSFCPGGTNFNANTRQYNILFGAQFPYRKYHQWTPFGELLFGHGGVRGEAAANGVEIDEVSSGLSLLAGGGVEHKINERFAWRVKADYLQTRTSFPAIGKAKQDNLRISVGIVIRNVHKKKRTLEEEMPTE